MAFDFSLSKARWNDPLLNIQLGRMAEKRQAGLLGETLDYNEGPTDFLADASEDSFFSKIGEGYDDSKVKALINRHGGVSTTDSSSSQEDSYISGDDLGKPKPDRYQKKISEWVQDPDDPSKNKKITTYVWTDREADYKRGDSQAFKKIKDKDGVLRDAYWDGKGWKWKQVDYDYSDIDKNTQLGKERYNKAIEDDRKERVLWGAQNQDKAGQIVGESDHGTIFEHGIYLDADDAAAISNYYFDEGDVGEEYISSNVKDREYNVPLSGGSQFLTWDEYNKFIEGTFMEKEFLDYFHSRGDYKRTSKSGYQKGHELYSPGEGIDPSRIDLQEMLYIMSDVYDVPLYGSDEETIEGWDLRSTDTSRGSYSPVMEAKKIWDNQRGSHVEKWTTPLAGSEYNR